MTATDYIRGHWLRARRRNHRNWSLYHYIPAGTDRSLCGNFHPSRQDRIEHAVEGDHRGQECRKCLEQIRWQAARADIRDSLRRRALRTR